MSICIFWQRITLNDVMERKLNGITSMYRPVSNTTIVAHAVRFVKTFKRNVVVPFMEDGCMVYRQKSPRHVIMEDEIRQRVQETRLSWSWNNVIESHVEAPSSRQPHRSVRGRVCCKEE